MGENEAFENADVTASIYRPSEHALGSLGIMRGKHGYRLSDLEFHGVFVWTGIFLNNDASIFYMDKKMRFQKYPNTCERGLSKECTLCYYF